jgi:hypothetical protein
MEIDCTIHAALHHHFHDCGAEPALLRLRHRRAIALVQFIVNVSPSAPQPISRRPASVESAPYFPALVASSCSASPMACAAAAFKRNLWPCTTIREPMRSAKGASWARTRSSVSTPCHAFRMSRS